MGDVLVFTAESMVERDSLIALLKSEGIETESPKRDISRKYTDSTVDLSYGGYSAMFDGFKIFVEAKNQDKAHAITQNFIKEIQLKNKHPEKKENKRNLMKFYYFSIAGFFIPIIPLFFGVYYLYKGILEKEKIRKLYMVCSLFFYGISIFVGYNIVVETVQKFLNNLS